MKYLVENNMKNFPPESEILEMEPDNLGAHMLHLMVRPGAETSQFNIMQMVTGGQVAERFMEAWGWL